MPQFLEFFKLVSPQEGHHSASLSRLDVQDADLDFVCGEMRDSRVDTVEKRDRQREHSAKAEISTIESEDGEWPLWQTDEQAL